MATTVTRPAYWILTLTSNTPPVFNFKFVVDIYVDGVQQVRLKQPKNANGSAHLSFENVVRNYTKVTQKHSNTITGTVNYDSIHLMPQNQPEPNAGDPKKDYIASENIDTLKLVTFKFSEEYASTSGGDITITTGTASDLVVPIINYANEWEDGLNFDSEAYDFDDTSVAASFLSSLPSTTTKPNSTVGLVPIITSLSDYKTLAFLNESTSYFDTIDGRFVYRFFEEQPNADLDNHVGQIQPLNDSQRGGELPSSATNEEDMLLFVGVGGANVKNIKYGSFGGFDLSANPNVKYYTFHYAHYTYFPHQTQATEIRQGDHIEIVTVGTTDYTTVGAPDNNIGTVFYATGTPTGTGTAYRRDYNRLSNNHLFEIASDNNCNSTRYNGHSLAWKNRFGAWDYYFFDGVSSEQLSFKRKDKTQRIAGSWNAASFKRDSFERGKEQRVTGSKKVTVNTRYITDEWNEHFKGLLQSNDVYLIKPITAGATEPQAQLIPINITDTSLKYKTNLIDKLVQYTFNFEMAHDIKEFI